MKKLSIVEYLTVLGINPTSYELNNVVDCDSLRDLLDKYYDDAPWCYNLNLSGELEETLNNHKKNELVYIESLNVISELTF